MSRSNIFDYSDYRIFLREEIAKHPRGFQGRLAMAIGCQATYLIRALRGNAQFTEDQAYRTARFLGLKSEELEYLMDLVRWDRAGDPELKKHYGVQIESQRAARTKVKNRLRKVPEQETSLQAQVAYFSTLYPSLIHIATSCSHLQTVTALKDKFALDQKQLQTVLDFLVRHQLVSVNNGRYSFAGTSIHLPPESALNLSFQRARKDAAIRSIEKKDPRAMHVSSAFATSEKHFKTLKSRLLQLIEDFHSELEETPSEEVFVFTVDLFDPE